MILMGYVLLEKATSVSMSLLVMHRSELTSKSEIPSQKTQTSTDGLEAQAKFVASE